MGLDFAIGHKKTPATCQSFNNYILQSKDATGLHYYLNNKKRKSPSGFPSAVRKLTPLSLLIEYYI